MHDYNTTRQVKLQTTANGREQLTIYLKDKMDEFFQGFGCIHPCIENLLFFMKVDRKYHFEKLNLL